MVDLTKYVHTYWFNGLENPSIVIEFMLLYGIVFKKGSLTVQKIIRRISGQ